MRRLGGWVLAAALLATAIPARAENAMGYRLLSVQEAAGLPHNHGALGLDVERAQQIDDGGRVFDIIRVKQVRPGSPGARAGLHAGDQIIAIDGRVFASLASFAGYVGSLMPGRQAVVDYGRRRPRPGAAPLCRDRQPGAAIRRRGGPARPVHGDQGRDRGWRRGVARLLRTRLLLPSRGARPAMRRMAVLRRH